MNNMLDETIVIEKRERGEFTPIPPDVYTVELFDIVAEQRPTYDTRLLPDNEKKYEQVFNFQFVLLEGKDGDKDLRGRSIFENFVPSFLYIGKNGKNSLYQIVEALQRQTISPEQEALGITGKELNMLIGKQCRVVTVNKEKGEKIYSNIDNYMISKETYPYLTDEERENSKIKPKEDKEEAETLTKEDLPFGN